MIIIKEVDSAGSGKVLLIIFGSIRFVFGFLTTITTFMGAPMPKRLAIFSLLLRRLAALKLPIFYGISGYLIGLLSSRLYNTFVGSKNDLESEVRR